LDDASSGCGPGVGWWPLGVEKKRAFVDLWWVVVLSAAIAWLEERFGCNFYGKTNEDSLSWPINGI
jgi:hypothetical protein